MEVPDWMVERIQQSIKADKEWHNVIDDLNTNGDAALERFRRSLTLSQEPLPIVRRSTYKSGSTWKQRVPGYTEDNGIDDPPVYMRGAKPVIRSGYSTVWGHENDIVQRFIRMHKLTSVGRSPQWKALAKKVNSKWPARWVGMPHCRSNTVYIEGIQYYPHPGQIPAIKTLIRHLKKLERVEEAAKRIEDIRPLKEIAHG